MLEQNDIAERTLLFGLTLILQDNDSPEVSGEHVWFLCNCFERIAEFRRRQILATAICLNKQNEDKKQMWDLFFEWHPLSQAGADLLAWAELDISKPKRVRIKK